MIAPPKRRGFRLALGLRTLFIVVTVAAVSLGWLAWQVQIVQERRVVKNLVDECGGTVVWDDGILVPLSDVEEIRQRYIEGYPTHPEVPRKRMTISWLRRHLGDYSAVEITIPETLDSNTKLRVAAAFPEANVAEWIVEESH